VSLLCERNVDVIPPIQCIPCSIQIPTVRVTKVSWNFSWIPTNTKNVDDIASGSTIPFAPLLDSVLGVNTVIIF
jgi:hypothetical protein